MSSLCHMRLIIFMESEICLVYFSRDLEGSQVIPNKVALYYYSFHCDVEN